MIPVKSTRFTDPFPLEELAVRAEWEKPPAQETRKPFSFMALIKAAYWVIRTGWWTENFGSK